MSVQCFFVLTLVLASPVTGSTLASTADIDAGADVELIAASISNMIRSESGHHPAAARKPHRDHVRKTAVALQTDMKAQVSAEAQARAEMEMMSNQSFRLDQRIQLVASDLKAGSPTKELLMKLSTCVPCNKFDRFGKFGTGYVMCTDSLNDTGVVAAYSYGVDSHDWWGQDVAQRYRIPVHQYAKDCLEPKTPEPCEGCKMVFHTECVVGTRAPLANSKYKTLEQNLEENGHIKDGSVLLKLDANGDEFEVLADAPINTLQKFHQVTVKFHKLTHQEKHRLYLRALKNLEEAGFAVAFLRGRNYGKLTHVAQDYAQFRVPDDLEVTYMLLPSQGCSRDLKFQLPEDGPDYVQHDVIPEEAPSRV